MKRVFTASLLSFIFVLMPAFAETAITAESLAACMLENSSETEEGALKDLMIKALQDAPASELQASTIGFGMSMITLATGTCGMNITQLQEPIFEEAAEIYGAQMGELVMGKAMAKVGG